MARLAAAAKPGTILALGPEAARVAAAVPDAVLTHIASVSLAALPQLSGRYDWVYVAGVVEMLPRPVATQLLARLRDWHAGVLYVRAPLGPGWVGHVSVWDETDFLALGMMRVNVYVEAGRPVHLYRFDLNTYKHTPDWFNSRYWAHPELWDKY